jgi:heme-degrading monooxygenase HmoA
MSYAFVVFHYPRPDYRHDLLVRMQEMAELMATVPGFIDAGQGAEEEGDCIAAISTWESKEACVVAALDKAAHRPSHFSTTSGGNRDPGRSRLREGFHPWAGSGMNDTHRGWCPTRPRDRACDRGPRNSRASDACCADAIPAWHAPSATRA